MLAPCFANGYETSTDKVCTLGMSVSVSNLPISRRDGAAADVADIGAAASLVDVSRAEVRIAQPLRRRNAATQAARLSILYISDSLGSPTHPRGIFNYSLSLVEMLKSLGATVDLVVEGSMHFSLEGRFGSMLDSAPEAVNSVRLSEIHRYFDAGHFGFRWDFPKAGIGALGRRARRLLSFWLTLRDRLGLRPSVRVRNDPREIDFTPEKSEHLNLFDNLLVKRDFYSSSMSRANLGLPAPAIDASGYDLAIVDTPHFIKLKGIAPERILTVLHDLIPLRDPTMEAHWRALFMRKLEATLAMRGHLVFVSRCTQDSFHAAFPRHPGSGEYVFYPAVRRRLRDDARFGAGDVASLWAQAAGRAAEQRGLTPRQRRKLNGEASGGPLPASFDATLPYFVTATSDEPRKNIATLAQAFGRHLRGRANVVILGRMKAARADPQGHANVYFPGYVSDAEKIAYLSGAYGLVFPSLSEGFGIPIIEGAAFGLPVVCSDIEVFREVAGDDAFFFAPQTPASLARAVEDALADPQLARERAAALRRSVMARFSQEAVSQSVRAALADLGFGD
jgi:glycosyltransferase involved in cell wall biosynthesis